MKKSGSRCGPQIFFVRKMMPGCIMPTGRGHTGGSEVIMVENNNYQNKNNQNSQNKNNPNTQNKNNQSSENKKQQNPENKNSNNRGY